MCVSGLGPTQIAPKLRSDGVMTPTEYWHTTGKKCGAGTEWPHNWFSATVARILDRQEYTGDTINFRSFSQSFKQKKRIDKPREEWKIFPDAHPAIIDRETFALVQNLRQHRRRPTRTGIVSMFSGLLYCADLAVSWDIRPRIIINESRLFSFAPVIARFPTYVPPTLSGKMFWHSWCLKAYNGCCGTFRFMKNGLPRSRWSGSACKRRKN